MINFDHVSKQYKNSDSPALDEINLQIEQGEFVFLVGESGSGKSSLLRLMLREEKPTSGVVTVNDINVGKLPNRKIPAFRRTMGIVFQDFRLLPGKSVFDNVAFGMEVIGKSKKEILERTPAVLELVGLEEKAHRLPSELSGGEQQRTSIARALLNKPAIVLADEPTGNLDSSNARSLHEIFLELRNELNQTFVIVTHNQALAAMSDRVLEMRDGNLGESIQNRNIE